MTYKILYFAKVILAAGLLWGSFGCVPVAQQREVVSFPQSEEPIFIKAKSNDLDRLTQMAEILELMKPFAKLSKDKGWLNQQIPNFKPSTQGAALEVGALPLTVYHKNGRYYRGHALGFDLKTKGVSEEDRATAQSSIKKKLYRIAQREFEVLRISKLK